ncbi:MAG: uncharacterized protein KVP18_000644 [Porospora cf. gigantea A]|uniref:uncharacterized protein n=1 Tax=Porospora cf. gigantea A TaxID=2853593 RepID=UPI0035597196|nr:MAG: hypothetical protein KVP18_000644 [Porospora cf. gigantea A]
MPKVKALDLLRDCYHRQNLSRVVETGTHLEFPMHNVRVGLLCETGMGSHPTVRDLWKQVQRLCEDSATEFPAISSACCTNTPLPTCHVELLDETKPVGDVWFPLDKASFADRLRSKRGCATYVGPNPVIGCTKRPRLTLSESAPSLPLPVLGDESFENHLGQVSTILEGFFQSLEDQKKKRIMESKDKRSRKKNQDSLYTFLTKSRRVPILVVPAAQSQCLINQSNIRQFLFDRKYTPTSSAAVDHSFTWTLDLRGCGMGEMLQDANGAPVDFLDLKVYDMTMTPKFTRWEWYSVVGVVFSENSSNFRRGFVCNFATDDIPSMSRTVETLTFDKTGRHLDAAVWSDFVRSLMLHLNASRDIVEHYSLMAKDQLPEKKSK